MNSPQDENDGRQQENSNFSSSSFAQDDKKETTRTSRNHEPRRLLDHTYCVDLLPQVSQADHNPDGLANTDHGDDVETFTDAKTVELSAIDKKAFASPDMGKSPNATAVVTSTAGQIQPERSGLNDDAIEKAECLPVVQNQSGKLPVKLRFKTNPTTVAETNAANVGQCGSANSTTLKDTDAKVSCGESSSFSSQPSTSYGMKSETNNSGCSDETDSDECKGVRRRGLHKYNLRENRRVSYKEPDSDSSVDFLGATNPITRRSSTRRKRTRPKEHSSSILPHQRPTNQESFQDYPLHLKAEDALHREDFDELHGIIKSHMFHECYHDVMQRMWYQSYYLMEEKRLGSALNLTQKYRVRREHPPPITISNDKKYHFNKETRIVLDHFFAYLKYPTACEKRVLAKEANLTYKQVSDWFKSMRKRRK